MDYIDSRKMQKLYVGTNRGVILTVDIQELLELDNIVDDYSITKKVELDAERFKSGYPQNFSLKEIEEYQQYYDKGSRENSEDERQINSNVHNIHADGKPSAEHQKLIDEFNKIVHTK
mmetsp:Transcript_602/g.1154  ORF Transcript_602/g.1154 Transcript_602/m.1154 type:complete len:118 (+) Transcript_602:1169-1522(+)